MAVLLPARAHSWGGLEDCGDAFEGVLALLAPADVAACRLVSRGWRREADLLLQHLAPPPGAEPAAVAATFPHLTHLQLTACASRGAACGGAASAVLPPLGALAMLRRLRSVALCGAPPAGGQLDCRALLPLAGAPPALAALELSGLRLRHVAALQQLTQLNRLHISGTTALGGWQGSLPQLLAPLRRLAHLHFSCAPLRGAGGAPAAAEDAAADAAVVAAVAIVADPAVLGAAGLLQGLSGLVSLESLELCCRDGGSDAAVAEMCCLPRLRHLAVTRCASFGTPAPSVSDASLALIARQLGGQLSSLALTGHQGVSDEGMRQLARCAALRHLELCLGAPGLAWAGAAEVTDAGVSALAALSGLRSLHLGGAVSLGEAGCASLARGLRGGLTSLQVSSCSILADPALFKLAPLAPGLRRLGLCGCEGVTDIGLAGLLRGASRLSHLDLAGCHRNITGIGLQVGGLRRLTHLDLAGCDAITDVEIEALLPAAHSLEHLNLRDCRVSDHACKLLAAASPNLRWLSLEHCPGVSDAGLAALSAGLPLLRELRLHGSGVSAAAAARAVRTPRGRPLKLGVQKPCWWVPAAAPAPGAAAAAVH